ncbi:MAG: HD domain-containing protein [Bacilli bacterium]|nr:HD domain-containing protein [Bacilli bacterium]
MILDEEKKKALEAVYQSFLHDEKILRMKDIPMHRGSNCYLHSFRVARLAIKRALRRKEADLDTILLGAILHDYYLYDWRVERDKMLFHARRHPHIAAENAERDFGIHEPVKRVIETHMWPFNLTHFPSSKEARIISWADKTIYWKEILTSKRRKAKEEQESLKQIATLF